MKQASSMMRTIVAAAALPSFAGFAGCHTAATYSPVQPLTAARGDIGCYGRILPASGTLFVSHFVINAGTPVVERIEVKDGDVVNAGQVLAVLSSRPYLQQSVASAEDEVHLASARLARVRAGGSASEQAALAQEVVRAQSVRDEAERTFTRTKALYEKDFISRAHYETAEANLQQADAVLARARAEAQNARAGRADDAAVAEAQLREAETNLTRAREDQNSSILRSPIHAKVLRVLAHPGEAVGAQGVAELAGLDDLEVIAEVYEGDIARVRVGQRADISADFLAQSLRGTVESIGSTIEKQQPLATDPGAPADARVFKVHIRIPNQAVLADRINGKVRVVLHA